jgi:hypothetical protein
MDGAWPPGLRSPENGTLDPDLSRRRWTAAQARLEFGTVANRGAASGAVAESLDCRPRAQARVFGTHRNGRFKNPTVI